MSYYIVKSEVERFLSSDQPEVLAIKGDWGVGKTFSWNKILQHAKSLGGISLKKYSYVSLFGIDSLDDFKIHMFQQQIPIELVGTEANLETLKDNTAEILESLGKKSMTFFQGNQYANSFTPALESVSFLSMNKALICLDDMERKGKNLAVKDILGLVSLLKEQKRCKVVLILNDTAFEDPGFKLEYDTYKEKVIDVELVLAPTARECVDVALHPKSTMHERLARFLIALDIKNIRIIKKIEKLAALLINALSGFQSEVIDQAMHSLVLFAWSYYVKQSDTPSMDYVKSIGNKMAGTDKNEYSDQEKLWQSILVEYGFYGADDFDLKVADTIVSGFVVKDVLRREAEKVNRLVVASKTDRSYKQAWRLYHDSFDDNQDEILERLYLAVKHHANCISPMDLNGCVHLFRDLDELARADELIEFFIDQRKGEPEVFDLHKYVDASHVIDPLLAQRFGEVRGETHDVRTLRQVVEDIAAKNTFAANDIEILSRASVDDFYNLFKNERGEHLNSFISICLKLGYLDGADERNMQVTSAATQALIGIASESPLNARRVAKFGVTL